MRRLGMLALALTSLGGCRDEIDLDPFDDTTPIEARVRPKPISGGTLTVVGDQIAIASDPDRDRVFIVDLDDGELTHAIELEAGDEPGRVVTSDDALAHVVLRGAGAVMTIDIDSGELVWRTAVCRDPRGIAYDPTQDSVHVACADGGLHQLDVATGDVVGTTRREPDLRDVYVKDGEVHVSRFRAAEVVGPSGELARPTDDSFFKPHVAWRTWVDPSTDVVMMLHQLATREEVPIDLDAGALDGGSLPYGGGGGGCSGGIMVPALTVLAPEGGQTFPLLGTGLVVDAAMSSDGWVAIAAPGVDPEEPSIRVMPLGDFGCFSGFFLTDLTAAGQITSVAFTSDNALVMQSREPARIVVLDHVHSEDVRIIELPGESRFDTGHEIFHRVTESNLSCASCHPEGMDDGHVWTFTGLGDRRTQSLEIGIEGTAPFHWDGDMEDLDVLMTEVLAHRMGGMRQSEARSESFARWLFEQERPVAGAAHDDADLVAEGELLFADYGCAKCHFGDKLGGATFETFAGKRLQVPSLRRVSLRPPFMHDGREKTLEGAVLDMIEGTRSGEVPKHTLDAITAYVRTL